ncbi:uncharacterized protein MYCFIDRAFT_180649 [Pseudocercospora fijiensis CIRAD86]|uniref:Uncharacterized protein n=1 Tax=Pseudocercospora fijiensis (strain CIRAD86) TaxID=383855 RepID=M3AI01_PSEFD|nr:uncharacterized protein MYCFIDRAFT_180649 [Pseudocercospora fijiensis CIRAD86]EME76828.1 hypothetical protein MYCFIDRAFT_180649 [Pseudocercospora fijiensis CIRAD86]
MHFDIVGPYHIQGNSESYIFKWEMPTEFINIHKMIEKSENYKADSEFCKHGEVMYTMQTVENPSSLAIHTTSRHC